MTRHDIQWASTSEAKSSMEWLGKLQEKLAHCLGSLGQPFQRFQWQRDGGCHGGGDRLEAPEGGFFNRASINRSQVQYEDDPTRPLRSATALSTIVHPGDPRCPSLHMHISWTQRNEGEGSWRLMADLNPSLPNHLGQTFRDKLEVFNIQAGVDAFAQGDHYFYIPSLGRHRGVCHFYLEGFQDRDFQTELGLADSFGNTVIEMYTGMICPPMTTPPTDEELRLQLDYHTLYFFQVLLLDRGTTAGLLVHDQNDEGILGSLPARVDLVLLRRWLRSLPKLQQKLLESLLDTCGPGSVIYVGPGLKKALAKTLRQHYLEFPETAEFQAKGFVEPRKVSLHQKKS